MNIRTLALAAIMAVGPAATLSAAVITVPGEFSDLEVAIPYDIHEFNVAGYNGGTATLAFNYGLWTGPDASISLLASFNGWDLGLPIVIDGAYFSDPAVATFDVSSLLVNGSNFFSVLGTLISGGPTTYAVGELELAYEDMAPVPLPASLLLLAGSMMVLAAAARRRTAAKAD